MKRIICFLMVLILLPALLGTALAGSGSSAQAATVKTHSGISTKPDLTEAEIRAKYEQYQIPTQRYLTLPSLTAPFAAGEVDSTYYAQSMFYLNFYRYLAKLDDLENSLEKRNLAQHGAVLLAANKNKNNYSVDHDPKRVSGMDDDFYGLGLNGCHWSTISGYNYRDRVDNLGWTWEQVEEHRTAEMLPNSVKFQIRDYEPTDFRNVGHRRYLLSPYMQTIGFGMADTPDNYVTYYLFDLTVSDRPQYEINFNANYDFNAWPPSGSCPDNMMEKAFPWSISLNEEVYKIPFTFNENGQRIADKTGIVIKVTRMEDGKVWTFDQDSPDGSASSVDSRGWSEKDSFFNFDMHMYGYGPIATYPDNPNKGYMKANALVFRPGFEDNTHFTGDYQVEVTGLKYQDGSAAVIRYTVHFFHLFHEWGGWTQTAAPTCIQPGSRKHTCYICRLTETEEIEPLGHDWGEWEEVTAPDCTDVGQKRHMCQRCGLVETETIAPLGHDWGDWEIDIQPTCVDPGTEHRLCSRCGAEDQQEAAALGHDWGTWRIKLAPTCLEPGIEHHLCTRCGAEEERPVGELGHDPGPEQQEHLVEPTCTEPGSYDMISRCTRCSIPLTLRHIETDPLGHDWDEWAVDVEPTCTETGLRHHTCTRCGEQEEDVTDALGHQPLEGQRINEFEPTCEEPGGYDSVRFCARCGVQLETEHVTIDPLGHDWNEGIVRIAPTCTEQGELDVTCQRCQFPSTLMIPALGHDWDEGVVTTQRTVEHAGEKTYTCLRCGQTRSEPLPMLTAEDNPFVDVAAGKFYYGPVLWAYYHAPQITSGTDESHFSPKATCTRGQVVTFLWNAMGNPEPDMNNNPFKDLKTGAFYYKAVLWAYQNGVTSGVDSTHFAPKGECTRGQVVTFLWNAMGNPEPTITEHSFVDVKEGKFYYKAMLWALEHRITSGIDDTHFAPSQTCTRGQVVTFLYYTFEGKD